MKFNTPQHGNIMTKQKDVEKYFSKVALHTYRPNNKNAFFSSQLDLMIVFK